MYGVGMHVGMLRLFLCLSHQSICRPPTYYIYAMQAWNLCDAETGLSLKGTNQSLILRRTKEYIFMGLLNPTNIPYKGNQEILRYHFNDNSSDS